MKYPYLEYLKVLPADFKSLPSFYYLSFKRFIRYFILHKELEHKEDVSELIKVKIDGIIFNVRKHNLTGDIGQYLLWQEPNVRKWFSFQKGEVFVDVGAYLGAYTLRAAKRGCTVYSFEPNPNSFKILSLNVEDNGFDNVKPFNVAVGDHEGEISIALSFDTTKVSDKGYKVKMITLDSLKLLKVDWLKIDVEGFEKEVLIGARTTLDVTDRVIIEVHKGNRGFVDRVMKEHEFRVVKEEETYPGVFNVMYEKAK